MLTVKTLPLGPFQTNCYLLVDHEREELVVVDPGEEPERLLAVIAGLDCKLAAIWNTHGHIDHINANAMLQEQTGAPITIHGLEADWLQDPMKNLAAFAGIRHVPSRADHHWSDGDVVEAIGRKWEVHHVPGHSPGQCALACREEKLLLAGDLLMRGSVGRVDFPTSDPRAMEQSLRALFEQWGEDDWRVLSGHGPETTIGAERRSNPFVLDVLAGRGMP